MKLYVLSCLASCVALFPFSGFAQNSLSEMEKAKGFELLFNGSDLTGWESKGNWAPDDGALFRKDKGGSLVYKAKPIPDDFELQFEWKISEKGNSGVYYRPGQYEYQVLHNQMHGDGKNPRTSAASLYFCMPPAKDATRPQGEWNEGRIVCKGSVIQHWLNGEKVVDFDYGDSKWATEVELLRIRGGDLNARGAFLSLQDHGDLVWYRSFKLRSIPAAEALVSENITPAPVPEAMLEKERNFVEGKKKAAAAPPK
ncbi:MAG: protein of unknown function (DUF1080) [Verrucomicrobia bacterium]|nr:MAG: protein of unknown function (DUF1080) [Verrucomicrobiota bacterium]